LKFPGSQRVNLSFDQLSCYLHAFLLLELILNLDSVFCFTNIHIGMYIVIFALTIDEVRDRYQHSTFWGTFAIF